MDNVQPANKFPIKENIAYLVSMVLFNSIRTCPTVQDALITQTVLETIQASEINNIIGLKTIMIAYKILIV